MKIGITCYPTYGGSGVVATELGKELAQLGHEVHFISYALPHRLINFVENNRLYLRFLSSIIIKSFPPLLSLKKGIQFIIEILSKI